MAEPELNDDFRAWRDRRIVRVGERDLPFLGLAALRANKRATGRPKDLAAIALLDEIENPT